MTNKQFIETIAPLIQKYAPKYGIHVVSGIIAQAILESGYGKTAIAKYHNYFGMKCGSGWKGKSVNLATQEEYTPGVITNIRDNFRAYDTMEEGVKGYFEFIQYSRYANLKTATTPNQYLTMIRADGWATDSSYVTKCLRLVDQWGLKQYDGAAIKEPYAGTITASWLRVRSGAGLSFPVVKNHEGEEFKLKSGICVAVLDEVNDWCCITPDKSCWISKQYVKKN